MIERILDKSNYDTLAIFSGVQKLKELDSVYLESVQFAHQESASSGTIFELKIYSGQKPIILTVNKDRFAPGVMHKVDFGIWIKKATLWELRANYNLLIKYKRENLGQIKNKGVSGLKPGMIQV